MNIVQLQDMLRGMPDDRLQSEMQQPSGAVPQYLVLSEIVRRDKARSSAAEAPKTTVVQDVMNQAQSFGGLESLMGQAPVAPEGDMQAAPEMYADGGFISPADAMGRAGVAGYPQPPQKQPFQLSSQPSQTAGSMFTPNTNPAPAPQQTFNLNQSPMADDGVQQNANQPSFMQQPYEYSNGYANGGVVALAAGGMPNELPFFIKREAERLGIDPVDLATAISYETAGTFNPAKKGPTTKWGQHIGLIQMGGPQREQYGYDPGGSLSDQMRAVGDYLADRGVKPGMGLLDVYSTINAGAPGLYNRSDEKAGGAPGTVADKVRDQMAGHREKAMNLFGMLGQNVGDMFLGTPVGMAGRETTAGLGQGAGAAAIGRADAPVLAGTPRDGGILSGIRSLFPEAQKEGGLGSDLRDLGSSMAQGSSAPEAPAAPMKSADISGLDRLRSSPEQELAEYAALRQQYITGGYANGGTVRMQDGGTPPRSAEEIRKEYEALPEWKKAIWATDDMIRLAVGSGLGGDYLAAGMKSLVGPETFEEELAAQQAPTNEARIRAGGASVFPEYLLPGGVAVKGLKYGLPALKYAVTNPNARSLLTRAGLVGGTGYLLAGGEEADPAAAGADADAKAAEDAKLLYESDPETRRRIDAERGPLNGDAVSPREAKEIAEKSQPTPFQMLMGSQEKQQKMLQDYYDSLIQLEKDRMSESQGFGAFLKEMGRGMLSNTSAIGPSLSAGAAQAVGSREDTRQAAMDKMRELQLAQKKAEIEGIAALDQLRYKQIAGDELSAREKAQYGLTSLISALKAAQDPMTGDPELAKAIQARLAATMKELGMGYETPPAPTEVEKEPESVFRTILGNI